MSKSLPVYDLSQWIKSDRNIGYVVARMSAANVWEVRDDYANRKDVERFNGRGAGYVIQWVELAREYAGRVDNNPPTGAYPYRLSWLRAETIAEKRYQPCENPVKATGTPETVAVPSVANDDHCVGKDSGIEASFRLPSLPDVGPFRPVFPLDIKDAATEATMRAFSAAGKMADDWLRAKGLTP